MTALRALTEEEFQRWQASAVVAYAADKVASGAWPAAEAEAMSRREHATLLPAGKDSPDNHLYAIVDAGGQPVGTLWFAAREQGGRRIAYVYNVEVAPAHRRQGHALRAFQALEAEVHRLGLVGIGLHVFGHNLGAQALYARLGFAPTSINLYKAVAS